MTKNLIKILSYTFGLSLLATSSGVFASNALLFPTESTGGQNSITRLFSRAFFYEVILPFHQSKVYRKEGRPGKPDTLAKIWHESATIGTHDGDNFGGLLKSAIFQHKKYVEAGVILPYSKTDYSTLKTQEFGFITYVNKTIYNGLSSRIEVSAMLDYGKTRARRTAVVNDFYTQGMALGISYQWHSNDLFLSLGTSYNYHVDNNRDLTVTVDGHGELNLWQTGLRMGWMIGEDIALSFWGTHNGIRDDNVASSGDDHDDVDAGFDLSIYLIDEMSIDFGYRSAQQSTGVAIENVYMGYQWRY